MLPSEQSASVVLEEHGEIVAAALAKLVDKGPILQPILVAPGLQRRGLGTAMLARVVNELLRQGHEWLYSRCHLGNSASLAWHHRNGFEELSDRLAAECRASHFTYEAHRLERQGRVAEQRDACELARYWAAEAKRIKALPTREQWPSLDLSGVSLAEDLT